MTKKEEELVFITLSEMLPYGVKVQFEDEIYDVEYVCPMYNEIKLDILGNYTIGISDIKPFLRPMSSMTEEEKIKLYQIAGFYYLSNNELLKDEWRQFSDALSENELFLPYPIWGNDLQRVYDWLNENHFDYRGLIERGLALEALDGMYGLKEK